MSSTLAHKGCLLVTAAEPGPLAPSVWKRSGFRAYLGSMAFSGIAFSMQQLLVSWLLVGVLLLPGNRVGLAQAIIGVPGIALMLWGGASADRMDPRTLLLRVYRVAPAIPLALLLFLRAGELDVTAVTLFGLAMSTVAAFSSPAQAALLSRIAGGAVQQVVSASTATMFLVQVIGLSVAGQLERLGLASVLLLQASFLGLGVLAVRRIDALPTAAPERPEPVWRGVIEGLRATRRNRVVSGVVVINFLSSVFNAGAFLTVLPFVIKRVYQGDAFLLATMMVVFFAGAMTSNLVMLRYMPFARPGRIFLAMQLVRVAILFVLWTGPHWWLLVAAIVAWGLLMGVTSTLARSIVQESAAPEFRGRILSVFTIGLLGSAPLGALVLGPLVEAFGSLNALLPAMAVSVALFGLGVFGTGIPGYRSVSTGRSPASGPDPGAPSGSGS